MKARIRRHHMAAGFSLLEVLVTLLIVSLGLLGMSKMQAAALSNSQIARTRSLVALQASSLAAAMHGNTGYWADPAKAPASVTAKDTTVTGMPTSANCANVTCTPEQLAAYDVGEWARNMNARFPSYQAEVTCQSSSTTPVSCIVKLSWEEKYIAINRSTSEAAAAAATSEDASPAKQYFSLYVEP